MSLEKMPKISIIFTVRFSKRFEEKIVSLFSHWGQGDPKNLRSFQATPESTGVAACAQMGRSTRHMPDECLVLDRSVILSAKNHLAFSPKSSKMFQNKFQKTDVPAVHQHFSSAFLTIHLAPSAMSAPSTWPSMRSARSQWENGRTLPHDT